LADAMLDRAERADSNVEMDARARWIQDHFSVPNMVKSTERELVRLLSQDQKGS
jgi:hypothetical protein